MSISSDASRTIVTDKNSRLQLDEEIVRHCFDQAPFRVGHSLVDHPLLQLPRIVEVSRELPEDCVEYNGGELSINQDSSLTPRNGLSIQETLLRIETCRSWMVLKNIQMIPDYRNLLDECLDQIEPLISDTDPGMCFRRGFIFVSSPGALTPYHADMEYNFLLQIRGGKTITVFDGNDRSLLSEVHRENIVTGGHRNVPYHDDYAAKGSSFMLHPGEGVHVPLSSPHWVRVGNDVSVSLSITFHSRRSARTIAVHKVNARLRKLGLDPQQAGDSRILDGLKYGAYLTASRLRRNLTPHS